MIYDAIHQRPKPAGQVGVSLTVGFLSLVAEALEPGDSRRAQLIRRGVRCRLAELLSPDPSVPIRAIRVSRS